jgi:hypothetical protein
MCQSGTVMISDGCQENLRFIHQTAEGLRVDNTVAIPLKFGTVDTLDVRMVTSLGVCSQKGVGGEGSFFSLQKDITHIAHEHDLLFFVFFGIFPFY